MSYQIIKNDWFGNPLNKKAGFKVTMNKDSLIFESFSESSCYLNRSLTKGSFVEGLWKYDLAELFISLEGESYLELNISANSNWWLALFSSYRKLDKTLAFAKVKLNCIETKERWQTKIEIDLKSLALAVELNQNNFKYNACMIRHYPKSPESNTDTEYLTLNSCSDRKLAADFHLAELRIVNKS